MRRIIFLILCIPVLASCSMSNRIVKIDNPKEESKGFKLTQTPRSYFVVEKSDRTIKTKLKVTSTYRFEERENAHPQITASFRLLPAMKANMADTELNYELDGEIIKIASEDQTADGKFILPENLWVSMVHAKIIHCSLKSKKVGIEMELSPKEKSKLSEFFHQAGEQRDLQFPAIPQGKKKW